MPNPTPPNYIFPQVGAARKQDILINPAAFRRKKKEDGKIEEGLSVNWVEYFQKATPQEAIPLLRDTFVRKGRKVGTTSKFALLNVGAAKTAAMKYATVAIVLNAQDDDKSHSLIKVY